MLENGDAGCDNIGDGNVGVADGIGVADGAGVADGIGTANRIGG